MREPLRQRKKARTRHAIINAGAALFQKKGFDATTLEEIAEAADVHKQTVLRYFKSKEEIAFARRIALFDTFVENLLNRSGSVIEYWRAYIEQTATAATQSGELKTWFQFIDSDTRLYAYQLRLNQRYHAALAEAFSAEDGVDPSCDVVSQCKAALLVSGNSNVARMIAQTGDLSDLKRSLLAVVDIAEKIQRPADKAALHKIRA